VKRLARRTRQATRKGQVSPDEFDELAAVRPNIRARIAV
jgi:hypothetical protein